MSKLKEIVFFNIENDYICGNCKNYIDCSNAVGDNDRSFNENDTCKDWVLELTEEELDAQKTDTAERITHAKEVEGGN